MSQPTAVLIGSDESVSQQLRWEAARRSVAFTYEFPTVRQALERLSLDPSERIFFFCEVGEPAELVELERLSNAFPGRPIAAVFTGQHDQRAVLEAMRAGAAQVVPFPLDRDDLATAINRLRIQFGHASAALRSIAVCGVHGGVGARTLTLNLAHALATAPGLNLRCLIGESVRSAGTICSFLGLNPRYTVTDLLELSDRLDVDLLRKTFTELAPNLYLLPAPREGMPRVATDDEYANFERLLPQLVDAVVANFDYVNDETILKRVTSADYCLLTAAHTVPSVEALKVVYDHCVAREGATKPTIVVGEFDAANKQLSVEFMEKLFGGPVYTIRKDDAVAAAANKGAFLVAIDEASPALQDILALARTVLHLRVELHDQPGYLRALWDWLRN